MFGKIPKNVTWTCVLDVSKQYGGSRDARKVNTSPKFWGNQPVMLYFYILSIKYT